MLKFHATLTACAVIFLGLCTYGMIAAKITLAVSPVLPVLLRLALLLAMTALCCWARMQRPRDLFIMTFWGILFSNLLVFPMYIIARHNVPLNDDWLGRLDARLGIEVPNVLRAMQAYPAADRLLDLAYCCLLVLMTLATMLPPVLGQMQRAKEYAIACVAAAALGMPLFAACQAAGPWVYYGFAPTPEQAEVTRELLALKTAGWFQLSLAELSGLICMPSYHTILALLAGTALREIPYLRWPSAVLTVLVVLSTLSTGWHYVSDVLAGMLVAIASLLVARGYFWLEPRLALPRLRWAARLAYSDIEPIRPATCLRTHSGRLCEPSLNVEGCDATKE